MLMVTYFYLRPEPGHFPSHVDSGAGSVVSPVQRIGLDHDPAICGPDIFWGKLLVSNKGAWDAALTATPAHEVAVNTETGAVKMLRYYHVYYYPSFHSEF